MKTKHPKEKNTYDKIMACVNGMPVILAKSALNRVLSDLDQNSQVVVPKRLIKES